MRAKRLREALGVYEVVAAALTLDRLRDLYAAKIAELTLRRLGGFVRLDDLEHIFPYEEWVVIGPAVEEKELEWISIIKQNVGVALADSAIRRVYGSPLKEVDVFVTDLDGDSPLHVLVHKAASLSKLVVIHAHGDNVRNVPSAIGMLVSRGKPVLVTVQVGGSEVVHDIGGFTDGDRALILALLANAKRVTMVGMDFSSRPFPNGIGDAPTLTSEYKLRIASMVIDKLSRLEEHVSLATRRSKGGAYAQV